MAFVTKSETFIAVNTNIAVYDAYVTAEAFASAALFALDTAWHIIGSTASVSAKVHTDTDDSPAGPNGVPIYRLDGVIIANDYDDLWDGSIQNSLNVAPDGTADLGAGVWTGTLRNGIGSSGFELGTDPVVDGSNLATDSYWIETGPHRAAAPQKLYAISDILTVSGTDIDVTIDIQTGKRSDCKGAISVAILGTDILDVTQIDQTTLSFEGLDVLAKRNGSLACGFEDIDSDGYTDLVCRYKNATTEGTLTGELLDGTPIEGADTFCVL